MAKEAKVKCSKCGKKVKLSSADVKGKKMLCKSCREIPGAKKPTSPKKTSQKPPSKIKIKMKCSDCNYAFQKSFGSKSLTKCPYCGSIRISEQESVAEKLLSEDEEFEDNRFFLH